MLRNVQHNDRDSSAENGTAPPFNARILKLLRDAAMLKSLGISSTFNCGDHR
jgi:hypothetical protein